MLIVRAIRGRLAADEGFTLIELVVAVAIGIVVVLGVTNLIDSGGRANARLTDKTETVQRTRIGMDRITRILRTQACLNDSTPPLIEGTDDSVTFYSDTPSKAQVDAGQDDATGTGTIFKPDKVKLTFSTANRGSVVQETWATPDGQGAGQSPGEYPTTPTTKRTLLDNIGRSGSTPFLRYYPFTDIYQTLGTPLDGALNLDPIPPTSVVKVVKIDIALQARPQSGNADTKRRTTVSSTVMTRNADLAGPSDSQRKWGPRCG